MRPVQREITTDVRLTTIVELFANSLEHDDFSATVTTLATQLANVLSCTRVSVGIVKGHTTTVCAISNSSQVDTRLKLIREISAAMNETVDQEVTLTWPVQPDHLPYVTFAQEVLAGHQGTGSVLSTPLMDGKRVIGAITLEHENPDAIDRNCIDICETLALLLGPVLSLKEDKEKNLLVKAKERFVDKLKKLSGPGYAVWKITATVFVMIVLFLGIATTDYRVTTQARLEGSINRAITSPLDGYIGQAQRRAGDLVKSGELLASLDNRELILEQEQLNSQLDQLEKEHRAAITGHDRSSAAIITTRKQQVLAKLSLIQEQLSLMSLKAPFDGIVVSGDLSQNIGTSVETGQVLFEIAPLDDYRVILNVDERDIGQIIEQQQGELTLTGIPDAPSQFTVNRILPISTQKNGRNYFEVQADLISPGSALRPGMEGIAKVNIDRRKLIWVWSHELIDWFRLTLWTWVS